MTSFNGKGLAGLTCIKAPGFWMVEHQVVKPGISDQRLCAQGHLNLTVSGRALVYT